MSKARGYSRYRPRRLCVQYPTALVHDPVAIRRFEQEASAASQLNHPNILTIYEIGTAGGLHFIASEFVEGMTLRGKLAAGPLRVEEAAGIAAQVASALAAAHAAGITHRDIKPENILIRADGLVKVVDFGIARLEPRETGDSANLTQTGMVLGTAKYMAPEQARGAAVDSRADIFSLGSVLYEMIAGKPPFEGASQAEPDLYAGYA